MLNDNQISIQKKNHFKSNFATKANGSCISMATNNSLNVLEDNLFE